MILDCFQYWPTFAGPMEELKNGLPDNVRNQLLTGSPSADYGIVVEHWKNDVVEYLDSYFDIDSLTRFSKVRYLEVTADEIEHFEYYYVAPHVLEHGRDVFFELKRPDCTKTTCPFGAKITSPVEVRSKTIEKKPLARIGRVWASDVVEVVVSNPLKQAFDTNGIIGLEYEGCVSLESSILKPTEPWIGRITKNAFQTAKRIIIGPDDCLDHSFVVYPQLYSVQTPRISIPPSDFVVIDNVHVNDYVYRQHCHLVISKKCLRLLLNLKVHLSNIGWHFREKFVPLVIT